MSAGTIRPAIDGRTVDIAIVGAGASGLLCLAHIGRLAQRRGLRLHVAVIDPAPPDSAGLAYSTTHAEHLMNVRACRLSAFDDEPDHFVNWMATQGAPVHPDGFAPRMAYGRYLRSVAAEAEASITVHRIHQRCLGIERSATLEIGTLDAGAAIMELDDGTTLRAGHLVLALGNARPVPLAGRATVVIDDPWDLAALQQIGADDQVVIVGTGLTAVDTLLALQTAGHTGHTTIVSRHGRWPAMHVAAPRTCVIPSPKVMEYANFGLRPTARSIVAAVRQALAERGDEDWQTIIDQVRPHTVRLWRALDDTERARFIRHARALWESHRHRMAPTIAERLTQILADERVVTMAGRIDTITDQLDTATVHVDTHHGAVELQARWVINCTGPSSDIRRRDDALVQSLLASGRAAAGWRGWGFDVDECGRVIGHPTCGPRSISAIGPLRLGADYETTAIPEIRAQAGAVAVRLVEQHARLNVA